MLIVYPVLRFFAISVVWDEDTRRLEEQVKCLLAGCRVMDLLTLIKTGFSLDYNLLQRLIVDRLARTSALYPDRLVPKDHFTMHLLDVHFQKIGARNEEQRNRNKYVDCFCLERKHKTCNRAISHTNNTRCYEKTMMKRVWISQKCQWMDILHFKA